ncbi:MAG TPA: hypothetical protein VMZ74_04810 [Ramlibacter sp.]|nr:hypothetical protein [Ramlibacter sp.]
MRARRRVARVLPGTLARSQPQRHRCRQDQCAGTHHHFVDVVPVLGVVPVVLLPVEPPIDGFVLELLEPGVVEELPLVEPVPVAPIDDVPLGDVLLVVVSVLLPELPVVVLGVEEALPLRLPLPVPELPVVVDGVVLEEELVAPVPLVPASLRWHAPSDRAATTARTAVAVWVMVVFIRNSLKWVVCNR